MRARRLVSMWRRLLWLVLLPLALFARDLWWVLEPPTRFTWSASSVVPVLLVLSGDPFELRTRAAAQLVLRGRAERLLISGKGYGGDSAEILAQTAYALGLTTEQVWLERAATNTYENVDRSLALLDARGVKVVELVIVTSDTHTARAGLVAERLRPDLAVSVHPVHGARSPSVVLREAAALTTYRVLGRIDLW